MDCPLHPGNLCSYRLLGPVHGLVDLVFTHCHLNHTMLGLGAGLVVGLGSRCFATGQGSLGPSRCKAFTNGLFLGFGVDPLGPGSLDGHQGVDDQSGSGYGLN